MAKVRFKPGIGFDTEASARVEVPEIPDLPVVVRQDTPETVADLVKRNKEASDIRKKRTEALDEILEEAEDYLTDQFIDLAVEMTRPESPEITKAVIDQYHTEVLKGVELITSVKLQFKYDSGKKLRFDAENKSTVALEDVYLKKEHIPADLKSVVVLVIRGD